MQTCPISPSAYALRKIWEREDQKIFAKFRKDKATLQVVNALAEMFVRLEAGRVDNIKFFC